MTRNHRKVHHLFWLLAAPILLALIVVKLPSNEGLPTAGNTVPAAAKIAALPLVGNLK